MTPRPWTYEEKIRLRVGMRFGLLETEALALKRDTIEKLEKAAFQLRAQRKDDLESGLQRELAPNTNESSANPLLLQSGPVRFHQNTTRSIPWKWPWRRRSALVWREGGDE